QENGKMKPYGKLSLRCKNGQVILANDNLWARARGIDAAEVMAKEVQDFVTKSAK
ncbi:iron-dicitrate transporter substrate-binding subunit, partial [Pasteurella multocida subsp. multocida str. Anand1_cattle]